MRHLILTNSIYDFPLYKIAHKLLHLQEEADTLYADEFCTLNSQVLKMADATYPLCSDIPEEEAMLCIGLLMSYNATMYNHGDKEKKIQAILDRALKVRSLLSPTPLKCRLLLSCYTAIYEEELLEEAYQIIANWDNKRLTDEEKELISLYKELFTVNSELN